VHLNPRATGHMKLFVVRWWLCCLIQTALETICVALNANFNQNNKMQLMFIVARKYQRNVSTTLENNIKHVAKCKRLLNLKVKSQPNLSPVQSPNLNEI
jgi:hypothetical protein